MSLLMTGGECFVLPTSEIPLRRAGHVHHAGDPAAETPTPLAASGGPVPNGPGALTRTGQDTSARAVGHTPAVTGVTNPALAPTVRQPVIPAPAAYGGAVSHGARLVRVGRGEAFPIRDGTAMIGRDRESDLVVSGPAVSRRHSIVRRSMRGYVVTDVSRNGTFVNGRRVRGVRRLRTGDVLRIGDEEFRFEASHATPYAAAALSAAVKQRIRQRVAERVAQLRRAVPLVRDSSRRVATVLASWAALLGSRVVSASRVAWAGARRTFWTIRARVGFALSATRRRCWTRDTS